MPRWPASALPALLALAACSGNPQPSEESTPVPVMTERALANCTYERLGTVLEERSGMVVSVEREVPRMLGRKARRMGADAIIEMKIMTIVPLNAGAAARGRASGVRASAEAIKFTSPACAENLKAGQKS